MENASRKARHDLTTPSTIFIDETPVGLSHPCFIIAEIGQAHDGSLGAAHAYIDAAARAKVQAVKFQTHIADAESTPAEPFRVRFSSQDATRYDYWKRMEFTPSQWEGLARHAREQGLIFLSSAFSPQAMELLDRLETPAWKVGAGELSNLPLLRQMAATGKPLLLSCGMSDWSELDAAMRAAAPARTAVFQCTSAYPCPAEKLGLNVLEEIRHRYGCPVGLSDHSGKIYAGLAAATLGANLLEVHLTFSRECFGPDVPASLDTAELKQLVEGVRFIEAALGNPIDKDKQAAEFVHMREIFGKSIVAARDLPAAHVLTEIDIALKKPGGGMSASQWENVLGCKLLSAVTKNTRLSPTMLRHDTGAEPRHKRTA